MNFVKKRIEANEEHTDEDQEPNHHPPLSPFFPDYKQDEGNAASYRAIGTGAPSAPNLELAFAHRPTKRLRDNDGFDDLSANERKKRKIIEENTDMDLDEDEDTDEEPGEVKEDDTEVE
jgi:hypothetical protein